MKTGVILLAAGSSSRLGRPKQLINYQGKTLIQKAIDEANKSQAEGLVGCLDPILNLYKLVLILRVRRL